MLVPGWPTNSPAILSDPTPTSRRSDAETGVNFLTADPDGLLAYPWDLLNLLAPLFITSASMRQKKRASYEGRMPRC